MAKVIPSDDSNQDLLDYNKDNPDDNPGGGPDRIPVAPKIPLSDDAVARTLHARSVSGEDLLPHDHKYLSDYHKRLSRTDSPYDGMEE